MGEQDANVLMDGLVQTAPLHANLVISVLMVSPYNALLEHIRQVSPCLTFEIVLIVDPEHTLLSLHHGVQIHVYHAHQESTNRHQQVLVKTHAFFAKLVCFRLGQVWWSCGIVHFVGRERTRRDRVWCMNWLACCVAQASTRLVKG
jgi:hypothetical protein